MSTFRRYINEKLKSPKFARDYEKISDAVNLGIALAERREQLELTQQRVAELTGIKQPMLARIERGQLPTMPTLRRLARVLYARVVIDDEQIRIEPKTDAMAIASAGFVGQWDGSAEIAISQAPAARAAGAWHHNTPIYDLSAI